MSSFFEHLLPRRHNFHDRSHRSHDHHEPRITAAVDIQLCKLPYARIETPKRPSFLPPLPLLRKRYCLSTGCKSLSMTHEELTAYDADIILVAPCGMGRARANSDGEKMWRLEWWRELRAVKHGQVYTHTPKGDSPDFNLGKCHLSFTCELTRRGLLACGEFPFFGRWSTVRRVRCCCLADRVHLESVKAFTRRMLGSVIVR